MQACVCLHRFDQVMKKMIKSIGLLKLKDVPLLTLIKTIITKIATLRWHQPVTQFVSFSSFFFFQVVKG